MLQPCTRAPALILASCVAPVWVQLATARGVLPASGTTLHPLAAAWRWDAFLSAAAPMLAKGFRPDMCGAALRYGEAMGAADALRVVARQIYGTAHGGAGGADITDSTAAADSSGGGGDSENGGGDGGDGGINARVLAQARAACWKWGGRDETSGREVHMITFERHAAYFDDVGGALAWRRLHARLGEALMEAYPQLHSGIPPRA